MNLPHTVTVFFTLILFNICNGFINIFELLKPTQNIYDMLDNWGYPYEILTTKTSDNYILTVHRIRGRSTRNIGPPVFIMHGLVLSSTDFVVMGPNRSLALILADAGYDVYLGNNRGNTFSNKHVYLDQNDARFWDYSYHEIGIYDIPAMIDLVINKSQYDKISYVGLSEGVTSFFVMGSLRQEYNDKILTMNAMAPVTDLYGTKIILFKILSNIINLFEKITKSLGIYVLFPHSEGVARFFRAVCTDAVLGNYICSLVFEIIGYSAQQQDKSKLGTIVNNVPAGMSVKQNLHYAQGRRSGVFCQYDYGISENLVRYGSVNPPVYNLSLVTAPIIIYYGDDDYYVNNDVLLNKVAVQLRNVEEIYKVPIPRFNHLDFIYGKNLRPLNNRVLQNINKANSLLLSKRLSI